MKTLVIDIPFALDDQTEENLANALAYLSRGVCRHELDRGSAKLRLEIEDGASEVEIRHGVDDLLDKLDPGRKALTNHVTVDRRHVEVPCREDVFRRLVESREVVQHGDGIFSLHGRFAKRFRNVDVEIDALAARHEAQPVVLPVTLGMPALRRSGFFDTYPHFANFISTLKEEHANITAFSDSMSTGAAVDVTPYLNEPLGICRSAVCLHSYPAYQDMKFRPDEHVCLSVSGRVFRNESKNASGLERLKEFTVRDLVYFGTEPWVQARLNEGVAWYQDLFERLGLQGVIQTAGDPFYANNAVSLQYYQRSRQSKLEARLSIPFLGKSIAVGSINNHGNYFSKSYNIRFEDGEFVTTGCLGVGFERLLYAILSQYGVDEDAWPPGIKEFARER